MKIGLIGGVVAVATGGFYGCASYGEEKGVEVIVKVLELLDAIGIAEVIGVPFGWGAYVVFNLLEWLPHPLQPTGFVVPLVSICALVGAGFGAVAIGIAALCDARQCGTLKPDH